ncbi:hypothetical protein KIW84_070341 [Lathyrus oleraceus]|uniref:Uncharacterized protein n=1 Tax=Pisum sativum TaxID=3888 RepID=A0A9D4VFH1_PEA|nr:hypothetical protein KIW84_070341 [Pisum sativum]
MVQILPAAVVAPMYFSEKNQVGVINQWSQLQAQFFTSDSHGSACCGNLESRSIGYPFSHSLEVMPRPTKATVANGECYHVTVNKTINKHKDQPRREVDDHNPRSSAVDGSLVDKRPGVHPETYIKRSTFFSWIKSWWPFQKSNAKADDSTAYQNKVTSNLEDFKLPELDQHASNLENPFAATEQSTSSAYSVFVCLQQPYTG